MTFARRVSSVESSCSVSVVVAACLQSFSWCVRCRVPCAVTVGVFDPVRFRFHSSLSDSLLRVFELAGVAVLAFARRTSPSRPRAVLVSDLEFFFLFFCVLGSWSLHPSSRGMPARIRLPHSRCLC